MRNLSAALTKEQMRERPMLFSGAMVCAMLDGRKTQTRRIVKPQPFHAVVESDTLNDEGAIYRCPYGKPGDRIWVKETFLNNALEGYPPVYFYRADDADKPEDKHWKPSIFMPRLASRLTLEITSIRVERLQDISEADAEAEGVDFMRHIPDADETLTARVLYEILWESINGEGSWKQNPWVWVIEFKRVEPIKEAGTNENY